MPDTRDFPIGDILSVTTGFVVSTSGKHPIDGVYAILNHMTGDSLMTHQLPRAAKAARPALLRQHPKLAGVDASGLDAGTVPQWVADQEARFGATLPVAPLAAAEWERRDPVAEAVEMFGADRVAVV